MKKPYYIDFPQEHYENQLHRYRCVFCKQETTVINGRLEGHLASCEYRQQLEKAGYDAVGCCNETAFEQADELD